MRRDKLLAEIKAKQIAMREAGTRRGVAYSQEADDTQTAKREVPLFGTAKFKLFEGINLFGIKVSQARGIPFLSSFHEVSYVDVVNAYVFCAHSKHAKKR